MRLLFLPLLLISSLVYSQSTPIFHPLRKQASPASSVTRPLSNPLAADTTKTTHTKSKKTTKTTTTDTTTTTATTADTTTTAATATKGDVVTFYGTAALSGGSAASDLASSFTASGKLSATVNPGGDFFLDIGANLLNVNPAKVKADSVDFSSLMFPESGNFGVFLSPYYVFDVSKWLPDVRNVSVVPLYEFAYRKYAVDSPNVAFKVFNHTLGLRLQWHYEPSTSNQVTVGLTFYKNWFAIPVEDVKSFTSIVNDSAFSQLAANSRSLTVGSAGIKFTFQYNTLFFFADFRKNAHTLSLADTDPFKGTVVNIGFSTAVRIGGF